MAKITPTNETIPKVVACSKINYLTNTLLQNTQIHKKEYILIYSITILLQCASKTDNAEYNVQPGRFLFSWTFHRNSVHLECVYNMVHYNTHTLLLMYYPSHV